MRKLIEEAIRPDVAVLLRCGADRACSKTAAYHRLPALEPAWWTVAYHEGLEPNNAAGRALRPAVLWRKRSLGCHSEEGCCHAGRLLTVVATLCLQGRNVLDCL